MQVVCLLERGSLEVFLEDTSRPQGPDLNDCPDLNVLSVIQTAREYLEPHELPGEIVVILILALTQFYRDASTQPPDQSNTQPAH